MSITATAPPLGPKTAAPARPTSVWWAGLLSYLVPGLGQIVQGRIGKGVLFLVCIYALFFYGLYLGSGTVKIGDEAHTVNSNVFLPDTADENGPLSLGAIVRNLYNRPQYVGQFWVGVVAWPALWQYAHSDREARREVRELEKQGGAGAEAKIEALHARLKNGDPTFGKFQSTPSDDTINAVQTAGDKRLEIAWVCTVIAGVLNIMVIYDAIAGPAFLAADAGKGQGKPQTGKAVA